MKIIDFEALRQRADMRRRNRFTVISTGDAGGGDIITFPSGLRRWACEQVSVLIPEPDPGPSAA